MKKILIVLFAVAVLAGCFTWPELGHINTYWEGFWGGREGYQLKDKMFETLTGIPAWAVKTSEQVFIHARHNNGPGPNTLSLIRTISLMRMTDANVTYVLEVVRLTDHFPRGITLVIGGREVTLKTETEEGPGGEFMKNLSWPKCHRRMLKNCLPATTSASSAGENPSS